MRVFSIFSLFVILLLSSAPPVAASAPYRVILSGGPLAHAVVIDDLRDTGNLVAELCSSVSAGSLAHRPAIAITIQWARQTSSLTWRGRFYPAIGAHKAAIDIPAAKMYVGSDTVRYCTRRIAGSPALTMLQAYHIPTTLAAR